MRVKGTKQLGSFTRGINLYVPKKAIVSQAITYIYRAVGAGLSPNINYFEFYDSGLTYNGKKSFYSANGQYAIWYFGGPPIQVWLIGPIALIGTFASAGSWGKVGATDTVTGAYNPAGSHSGNVTILAI